ncbi:MAG: hypothetical protein ACYC6N_10095 [Pirellulaceae bacterium]
MNRARSQRRVLALVDTIIRRFGGIERFAATWHAQVDRVRQSQPMAKKTLDFFRAVTRMAEVSEGRESDPHELSDDELAEQLLASTEHLLSEHPQLVLRVAEGLGWTVVPPGG